MIKFFKLQNFQRHSLLELNFQEGINILYGESHSGKSSIVRALRWILFDDFNSNEARKQGTKETIVTVIFDNNISVSRIKSNSVNAYEVEKDGETKRFDSIGKGVPEEIQKIFAMELFEVDGLKINLNISEQLSAPFLLGKEYPSTFRAKLFNQLTGNDLQDKLFKELNRDILQTKKDITIAKEQINNYQLELQTIEPQRVILENKYNDLHNSLLYIEDLNNTKDSYLLLFQRLRENQEQITNYTNKINSLKTIDLTSISARITQLNTLNLLVNRLNLNKNTLNEVQTKLSKIKPINLQFDEIYAILNRVQILRELQSKLAENRQKLNELKNTEKQLDEKIKSNEQKLLELKKNFTLCPLCDKAIPNEELEKIRR